ncbi:MAG: VanW family protein [Aphanothece sp. CMT-3BRIN-NPC111]|jgi:vancomycin resistance protein VanW|nr:VanW family protein [Aphanothece sp. CMT-3BRIN-NPC111]
MKKLIPSGLRVRLRVWQRYLLDLSAGQVSKFVKYNPLSDEQKPLFQERITIFQALMPTTYSENKKHNLALAIKRIQDVAINPGEIFSFWYLVGEPDRAKGYLEGRSLVDNQLKAELGGGLCQLSGIIYFLALKAGLVILERHSHSHDIYTESTRFTPLGSDATIVYGYKDIRFLNNLEVPVCFRFTIKEHEISAALCSPQPITEFKVEFKLEELKDEVKVDTVRFLQNQSNFDVVNSTSYQKLM